MAERERNEREMSLAPNEYAYVKDQTTGDVGMWVGPCKQPLGANDQPVIFDLKTKRFKDCDLNAAIAVFATAPEGWYVELKNPAPNNDHPNKLGKVQVPSLQVGKKINIPGPVSFPLWPGQMAQVVRGHTLALNQYLVCRMYDEAAARANWKAAVLTPAENEKASSVLGSGSALTMGQLLVIKGTEASFFIPPTGIQVVKEGDSYVQDAVTLERLEYCLLIDQTGKKRYEQGPAVVFPAPTERFAQKKNDQGNLVRKFRAIELTEISGIHIKVIAPYVDGDGRHEIGEELFIDGTQQRIYFPREEHAIVKYDDREVYYGIAIPEGEARYVLNRLEGNVVLVRGPDVYLPDPRNYVMTQRILDSNTCAMLYPGNTEALKHNASLAGVEVDEYLASPEAVLAAAQVLRGEERTSGNIVRGLSTNNAYAATRAAKGFSGDSFNRPNRYTPPRTVTLGGKFEGAVSIDVWPGYAVQLVRRSGSRRVVVGPQTVFLEYDESPQILELSTGKPKNTDSLFRTAYLCVQGNMVTDIIKVETRDFCKAEVKVSYRVNFEGDESKWFNISNYVKFMCDAMRSRLRARVQQIGIEEFYANHVSIIRDTVLGTAEAGGSRPGAAFSENGMRIYDAEVLDIQLQDKQVADALVKSQRDVIQSTLALANERRILEYTVEMEEINRTKAEAKVSTELQLAQLVSKAKLSKIILEEQEAAAANNLQLTKLEQARERDTTDLENQRLRLEGMSKTAELDLSIQKSRQDQELELATAQQKIRLDELNAETQAVVAKVAAIKEDLIAAMQAFGDRELIGKLSQSMSPLAILGGESVVEVASRLLNGSFLAKQLVKPNGSKKELPAE